MRKARLAVLLSGDGSNLQAMIDGAMAGKLPHVELALVISNKQEAYGIERAKLAGIATAVLSNRTRDQFETEVLALLDDANIQLVALAGFTGILSSSFIDECHRPIINVHPSLIPAFSGPGFYGLRVHRAALDAGVKVSGATVHMVNALCDGGTILAQDTVRVLPNDTPETLQQRIANDVEHVIYPATIEALSATIVATDEHSSENSFGLSREENTMAHRSLADYLGAKTYPGRTLAIAVDEAARTASIVYFIMGRSANSQNRIFVQDGDVVRTQAFDETKVEDPSLIIYPVYEHVAQTHIITNGDQTQTIADGLATGVTPAHSLLSRECEPDAPNFTPRISLVTDTGGYALNIIKAAVNDGSASVHFDYRFPYVAGTGHCIHTYVDDGDPLPPFAGEPVAFDYEANLGRKVWEAINPEFKISLLECVFDLTTHEMRSVTIFNKHHGD